MNRGLLTLAEHIARKGDPTGRVRKPLVIERGPDGILRSTRICIHEDDLREVCGPNLKGQYLQDFMVEIGCEFIDRTGRYAGMRQTFDPVRREFVLWIEGGAIINPEVERLRRDDFKQGAIEI